MSAWSKEPPTEPGAYWYQRSPDMAVEVVGAAVRDGTLAFHFWASRIVVPLEGNEPLLNGLWGPRIEEPPPPPEADAT